VQSHLALTGHMRAVLAVFVNEEVWQALTEAQRTAISKVLDDKARESLEWANKAESELVDELKGRGMTVIGEAEGLDLAAFRTPVQAQIAKDFPAFTPLIEQIEAIK
jgi:TRAP-type C4-dicarboxylate transport system substrate-binding protein